MQVKFKSHKSKLPREAALCITRHALIHQHPGAIEFYIRDYDERIAPGSNDHEFTATLNESHPGGAGEERLYDYLDGILDGGDDEEFLREWAGLVISID